MNKEYVYIDGKAIIEDENGNKRVTEYSDKLEEILVQENLIESIEERLAKVDKEINDNNSYLAKNKKWTCFIPLVMVLAFVAFIPIYVKLLIGNEATMLLGFPGPFFSNVSISTLATVVCGFCGIFLSGLLTSKSYSDYKELIRVTKGLLSEKIVLEEELVNAKVQLKELAEIKKPKVEKEEFIEKNVDDKEVLTGLKEYLELRYNCGYNEEKYAKYYENGTLYKKLRRDYTDDGIKEIENYLENNASVKKKTLSR